MKDYTIKGKRIKYELITFLVCFIVANLLNLYAIIRYDAPASELITSIFYVITFAAVLYAGWAVIRILYDGIKRMLKPNEQHKNNKS